MKYPRTLYSMYDEIWYHPEASQLSNASLQEMQQCYCISLET